MPVTVRMRVIAKSLELERAGIFDCAVAAAQSKENEFRGVKSVYSFYEARGLFWIVRMKNFHPHISLF